MRVARHFAHNPATVGSQVQTAALIYPENVLQGNISPDPYRSVAYCHSLYLNLSLPPYNRGSAWQAQIMAPDWLLILPPPLGSNVNRIFVCRMLTEHKGSDDSPRKLVQMWS